MCASCTFELRKCGRIIRAAGLSTNFAAAIDGISTPTYDTRMSEMFSDLANLWRLSSAQSRSISPENFSGEKGRGAMATEGTGSHAARELGQGWKVSPSVRIEAGQTFELANI